MKRRIGLIGVRCVLGLLGTFLGPFVFRLFGNDAVDVLVDTADTPRVAVLLFAWRDSSGHIRHATAHMPYAFESSPDADSTFQHLRRIPLRN